MLVTLPTLSVKISLSPLSLLCCCNERSHSGILPVRPPLLPLWCILEKIIALFRPCLIRGLAEGAHALEAVVLEEFLATLLSRERAVLLINKSDMELIARLDVPRGHNADAVIMVLKGNLGIGLARVRHVRSDSVESSANNGSIVDTAVLLRGGLS